MAGEFFYPNITGAFDWGTLLDGIMQIESIRLKRWENQKKVIDQKLKYLNDLKAKLNDLVEFTAGINKKEWFNKKTIENLNPDIVDVQLIKNDIPEYVGKGTVNKVAQIEIDYFTREFKSLDEQFNADNPDKEYHLTLHYHTVDDKDITKEFVFYGRDTLRSLIEKINNDPDISPYLHAYTMYTGNGYRFAIMETDVRNSADESEAGGPYPTGELEDALGDYYTLQGAKNSEIQVGDAKFDDPGYTFTNIFPGVKIRVKKPGDFQFNVKTDYKGIADVFMKFVNKVNDVIRQINNLTKVFKNGDKVSAPKLSDYELKELKIRLQRLFEPILTGKDTAPYNIVDYNPNDGTVTVNKDKLLEFLKKNPKEKWEVFYDVVKQAKDLAELATQKAYLAPLIKGYEEIEKRIEERIENYREYLLEKQEFLKKRFASVETYVAKLQNIQAKINQILTAQMLLST
jgi:flagellar hook-associated protein 2